MSEPSNNGQQTKPQKPKQPTRIRVVLTADRVLPGVEPDKDGKVPSPLKVRDDQVIVPAGTAIGVIEPRLPAAFVEKAIAAGKVQMILE